MIQKAINRSCPVDLYINALYIQVASSDRKDKADAERGIIFNTQGQKQKSGLWVNCSPHSIVWFVSKFIRRRIPSIGLEVNAVWSL